LASTTYQFRVSYRKLVISLFLTVVPLSLFALITATRHSSAMEELIGSHSQAMAEGIVAEINQFVRGHVIEANLMASDSAVVAAVREANRSAAVAGDASLKAKIERIESIWNQPEGASLVNALLSSPASKALRHHLNVDQEFLRITVTDEKGTTVAATHKTLDYYQADEEYWQNIYAKGRGAISLTNVLYDEASKASYIGVGVPVVNEDYEFIGTFDALVNVAALGPMLARPKRSASTRILLVKSDGTIISSTDGRSAADNVKSVEHLAVADARGPSPSEPAGFVNVTVPRTGELLIGYSEAGLKADYQSLGWMVLVAEPASDAYAPVATTSRMVIALGFLGLLSVTFVLVFLSLHRKVDTTGGFHPAAIAENAEAAPKSEPVPRDPQ
jgi:hypothetical protein